VGRRFVEDRCTRAAAALSYTTVLALVPLTVVAFALLAALPVSEELMVRAQAFVYGNFVTHFSSHRVVYGALATLPVFLIWIYLSWTVVLLGAVVTAELPRRNVAAQRRRAAPRRAPGAVRDAGGGTGSARTKR
jgi:membrane protein